MRTAILNDNHVANLDEETIDGIEMTEDDKLDSAKTVAGYIVCLSIFTSYKITEWLYDQVKYNQKNNRFGFKMEMKRALAEAKNTRTRCNIISSSFSDRVRIINTETWPYFDKTIMKMQYGFENILSRYGCKDKKLLASAIVAQAIVSDMCELSRDGFEDYRKLLLKEGTKNLNCLDEFNTKVMAACPNKLNGLLKELSSKISILTELDCEKMADINDCETLKFGLGGIRNIICDAQLLLLHHSFAYEETKGEEWLKKNAPWCAQILHPDYKKEE